MSFSDRPRPVYCFAWSRAREVLEILKSFRDRVDELLKKLEAYGTR